MKAKKVLALFVAAAMTMSLAACGNDEAGSGNVQQSSPEQTTESTQESSSEVAPESSEEPGDTAPVEAGPASIDFEDGLFGFIGDNTSVVGGIGNAASYNVVDFGGSKALEVVPDGKGVGIGFQIDALLGDKVSQVKTVELSIGTKSSDGKFYASSGKLYGMFAGEKDADPWSVYLETANPKTATYEVPEGKTFGEGDNFVVSLETDNANSEGAGWQTLYIDNVTFKDASGNVIEADSSAEYIGTVAGEERNNLATLKDIVEFEGFATSGDGWSQQGFDMPQEFIDALVPGSVIEISYTSETGDMWLLMNGAEAGWFRCGATADPCGPTPSYYNNSKNIAQITYDQLVATYGEDVSTWGTSMQCESSGAWEVYSVKVGQASPTYSLVSSQTVEFEGFATSGEGWSQQGFDMPQEFIDALVPGSAIEISYTSESGDMWLLMNGAEAGWIRCGATADPCGPTPSFYNSAKDTCWITYDMLAETYGDDVSTWGTSMQCESSGAWEVYSVKVGPASELPMVNNLVEFEGFATSGEGWSQQGFDMPQEFIDALVPGSVIQINYTSESGDMWLLMNGAEAGWIRCGATTDPCGPTPSIYNSTKDTCWITYDMLAETYGDDVSTWGTSMQCESSGAWEVYSVSAGIMAE